MHQIAPGYDYPRVYRAQLGWRFLMVAAGLLFGGLGIAGFWSSGYQNPGSNPKMLAGLFGVFIAAGLLFIAYALRTRVVFGPLEISTRNLFGEKSIRLDEIVGTRLIHNPKGPDTLVLLARSGSSLKIGRIYAFDAPFNDWLSSLSNLDLEDTLKATEELESDESLGATRAERQVNLAKARRFSQALMVAGFLLTFWGIFYPSPYYLVIAVLVALPWVALLLVAKFKGIFRLDGKRNDPHPNVAIPLVFPGFGLLMRATTDFHFMGWQRPLVAAVLISVAMCVLALKLDASVVNQKATMIAFFFLLAVYGFGVCMHANALLDRSSISVYPTKVVSKYFTHGKSTSYHLRLAAWGTQKSNSSETVSRSFYGQVQPGDTVCISLRSGALGIPWYRIHPCR